MQAYRIPQKQVQVVVHMRQGVPLRGCLFLPEDGHGGFAQRLTDRLADPDNRFFALSQEGKARLISRDWILRIDVLAEDEAALEVEPAMGDPVPVACHLADGSILEGTVSFAMPPGRQRLIDYINSVDGFVPLRRDGMLILIHIPHVIDWVGL